MDYNIRVVDFIETKWKHSIKTVIIDNYEEKDVLSYFGKMNDLNIRVHDTKDFSNIEIVFVLIDIYSNKKSILSILKILDNFLNNIICITNNTNSINNLQKELDLLIKKSFLYVDLQNTQFSNFKIENFHFCLESVRVITLTLIAKTHACFNVGKLIHRGLGKIFVCSLNIKDTKKDILKNILPKEFCTSQEEEKGCIINIYANNTFSQKQFQDFLETLYDFIDEDMDIAIFLYKDEFFDKNKIQILMVFSGL